MQPLASTSSAQATERRRLFELFAAAMDEAGVPWCLLGRVDEYPDHIASDVDFMVPEAALPRVAGIAARVASRAGGRLVQCLQHEIGAAYFAVCTTDGARVTFLHLDVSGDYRRGGRRWLSADDIVASRVRNVAGLWVPSTADAFVYYLVKRIDKRQLDAPRVAYLKSLRAQAPDACEQALRQRFGAAPAQRVGDALAGWQGDVDAAELGRLREMLQGALPRESLLASLRAAAAELLRKARRILQPTGLVIGFLGPDGAGKSTLIERMTAEVEPAFRQRRYFHLRPNLLIRKRASAAGSADRPHDQVPRPSWQAVLKTALLCVEYVAGWAVRVRPLQVRSTLVIFDRYFHDMLADPRRYRLAASPRWLHAMSRIIPAPDVWIVLDAPVEVLQARKSEVDPQGSAKQRTAYRALAPTLAGAHLVDTARDVDACVAEINGIVLGVLAARTRGRLGLAAEGGGR